MVTRPVQFPLKRRSSVYKCAARCVFMFKVETQMPLLALAEKPWPTKAFHSGWETNPASSSYALVFENHREAQTEAFGGKAPT